MDERDGLAGEREEVLALTGANGREKLRADRRPDRRCRDPPRACRSGTSARRRERDTGLGQLERGITRSECGTLTASSAAAATIRFPVPSIVISVDARNGCPRLAALAEADAAAIPAVADPAVRRPQGPAAGDIDDRRHEHHRRHLPALPPASVPWATGLDAGLDGRSAHRLTDGLHPPDFVIVGGGDEFRRCAHVERSTCRRWCDRA